MRTNLRRWHRMTRRHTGRWNFKWRLKVDRVSIERMYAQTCYTHDVDEAVGS